VSRCGRTTRGPISGNEAQPPSVPRQANCKSGVFARIAKERLISPRVHALICSEPSAAIRHRRGWFEGARIPVRGARSTGGAANPWHHEPTSQRDVARRHGRKRLWKRIRASEQKKLTLFPGQRLWQFSRGSDLFSETLNFFPSLSLRIRGSRKFIRANFCGFESLGGECQSLHA
jgi:hypothetical protein